MLGSLKLNSITKSNVASLDIISITQTSSLLEVYVSKMILTKWKRSCVRLLASSSYSLGKRLGKPYITCEPIWTSYTYKMEGFPYNRCSEIVVTAFTITPKPFKMQKIKNQEYWEFNRFLTLYWNYCFLIAFQWHWDHSS